MNDTILEASLGTTPSRLWLHLIWHYSMERIEENELGTCRARSRLGGSLQTGPYTLVEF